MSQIHSQQSGLSPARSAISTNYSTNYDSDTSSLQPPEQTTATFFPDSNSVRADRSVDQHESHVPSALSFPSFQPTLSTTRCNRSENFDDLTTNEVVPASPQMDSVWTSAPVRNVGAVHRPGAVPGCLSCDFCPDCPTPFCHVFDRQSLSSCAVPRGFLKTILADSNGSGKTYTVISMCMYNDSRNNWVMVRNSQLPSWRYHCQQYTNCKVFVIASTNDVNTFFSMRREFRDPALQFNIILVVSNMVSYTGNKAPQPFRLFIDDNDISLMNVISGQFNYVLASDITPATNSFVKSNHTNLIQTHDACIETLFDLPPIMYSCQCSTQPAKRWNFSCSMDFCIDLNAGNEVNNSALLRYVLFSQEHYMLGKLTKAIRGGQRDIHELRKILSDPENDTSLRDMRSVLATKEREMNEIRGNIQYQTDRIMTGSCIICLSRDYDYVVTHCCRNNICCECLVKIDRRRCPYCRIELDARNSFTPVIMDKTQPDGTIRISDYFAISPVQLAVRYVSQLVAVHREHMQTCKNPTDNGNWCAANSLKIVMCSGSNMSVMSDLLSEFVRRFRTHHLKQLSVFQSCPEPAVLLISNTNKVVFYDLPFVTHVVLVGEVNPLLAQSLLTKVNRYGRRRPLYVQQFIAPENMSIREYLVSRGRDCPRVLRDIVSEPSNGSYMVLDNFE